MSQAIHRRLVVGITGASGALYSVRLLKGLAAAGVETHVVITSWGRRLLRDELGIEQITTDALVDQSSDRIIIHPPQDLASPLASGSFLTEGMIICPCSTNTLGRIASGTGDNLLIRAAAVTLKESRKLVLVLREMPLSQIDLKNMLTVSRAGAVVCPACPGFYMLPTRIDQLVDFVVGKVLDLVQVPHDLNTRWPDSPAANRPEAMSS